MSRVLIASLLCALVVAAGAMARPDAASAAGASQFSGTVVDASGNPIAGDYIVLTDASGNTYTTTTGTDGTYSINVPSGSYQFILSNYDSTAPDSPISLNSTSPLYELPTGALDLSSSQTGLTLTAPLEPVTVQVLDPSGAVIPGATVQTSYNGGIGANIGGGYNFLETDNCPAVTLAPGITTSVGFYYNQTVPTDASGTATFDMMACGDSESASFYASAPGYTNSGTSDSSWISGPTTLPTLLLLQTGGTATFSGVVQDAEGDPLPDVSVSLQNNSEGPGDNFSVTTDANGNFSLTVPASLSPYQLSVSGTNPDGSGTYQLTASPVLSTDLTDQVLTVPLAPLQMTITDGSATRSQAPWSVPFLQTATRGGAYSDGPAATCSPGSGQPAPTRSTR